MKTIYLIRHAKSSWEDLNLDDHERPLNERGKKDAGRMARYLEGIGIQPEICLCSTSKRTKETYSYFTPIFMGLPLSLLRKLYHASVDNIVHEIKSIDNNYDKSFLFGHNNGISEFVSIIQNKQVSLSTCSFTEILFDVDDWKEIDLLNARINAAKAPKDLPV